MVPTATIKGSGSGGGGRLETIGRKTSSTMGIAAAAPARDAISRNQKTRQGNFLARMSGALSVDPFGILGHHSIAAKKRHKSLNRSLHHRDPAARNGLSIAVVIASYDFAGENPIHRLGFATIGLLVS